MELITIIIIVSIILIVIAFVYSARAQTRKQRQILSAKIQEIADANKLTWHLIDIGLHRALAWAMDRKMLLFIDFAGEQERIHLVDMNEIGSSHLHHKSNMILGNNKSSTKENIISLELQLFYKDRSKEPVALQFYNEIQDGLFEKTAQIQKAEHWKALISK